VPESGLHSLARRAVHGALPAWYAGRADCWCGADRNIYYRHGDNGFVVAPDVIVSFGVDPEPLRTAAGYCLWEVGAPPPFVLEIASPKTFTADVQEKPAKYLEMGGA
jgi:Uma2 family endonuclease